jgi:hypothetical protein
VFPVHKDHADLQGAPWSQARTNDWFGRIRRQRMHSVRKIAKRLHRFVRIRKFAGIRFQWTTSLSLAPCTAQELNSAFLN